MRRPLIVIAWIAGAITLLIAVLAGLVLIGGNTDSGRRLIERMTDRLTAGHVLITGLQGSLPAQLTIAELRLRDERGVWLSAEHVAVRWAPWKLLAHRVDVQSLEAAHVAFERLPVASPESPAGPIEIPVIEVATASIEELQVGPALAGERTSVTLHGAVLLRSLEDASGDVSARRLGGDGSYDLHFHFDRRRMDGRLQMREPAQGPLQNFLQVPGLGALAGVATISGERSAEHVEIQLDAGNLHGRAQGEINLIQGSAEVDYSLAGAQMQARADLGWRAIALHGSWHGTPAAPRAEGELHVEQLQLPGGWGVADLTANLTSAAAVLAIEADAVQLQIPSSDLRFLERDPLHLSATIGLAEASRPLLLKATTRLLSLDAQAATAGARSAVFTLRVNDLRPFAQFTGEQLRGSALLKGDLAEKPAGMRLAVDANVLIDADTADPQTAAGWRKLLGNRPMLKLAAELTARSVAIEQLQLTGRGARVAAHGSAARGASGALETLGLHWDLDLSDLADLSTALNGRFSASGDLAGPMAALALNASMNSTLSIHGSAPGALTGTFHARGWPSAPIGSIALLGMIDGAPMQLDAAWDRGVDGGLRATIRHGNWKSAQLQGAITFGTTTGSQARGRLDLHVGELGDLDRLLGMTIHGSADLSCEPRAGALDTELQLRVADLGGSAGALPNTLAGNLPGTLAASATVDLQKHTLGLVRMEITSRQQQVRLLAPAFFSFVDGITVDRLRLGEQQAQLNVSGRLLPSFDVHASLEQVRPALVNVLMPDLLDDGTISAEAEFTGSPAHLIGDIRMRAAGIRFASEAASGLPAADFQAELRLDAATATVDGRLTAGKNSQLAITGRTALDGSGPIALQVDGKLDIGLMSPLLEARGLRTTGDLNVALRVGGTAAAPEIGGTIQLANASLRDYVRGINLSEISAQFSGNQGALKIDRFTARAAAGSVSLSGTIGILQPRIPVYLKLTADHAEAVANSLITANLDAAIEIKGTALDRLNVVGSVQIHRATIGIPSALPPTVAVLDVRRRGKKPPLPLEPQLVIGLDIAVHAPNEILVQGRGLDAELGGDLQIGGTVDVPTVGGGFDLQRGSFSIAGNTLPIQVPGRVSFDGAGLKNKLDPTLDFKAQKNLPDSTTVTLSITGLADAPKFDFTSSPQMPQDEILARLLFGVPTSQLTPLMAAQIGAALAILSVGGDGGFNPLTKLQKSLGLDRINFGSNATAAAAATGSASGAGATGTPAAGYNVAAGRYIAKRVYVEAKQSTTGSTQLQVDVDLSKHLKLQTRLGNGTAITQGTTPENDPGSSIGITYQIEY